VSKIGDTQIMASADRCTVHPQHVLVNEGRDESLYGDVWRCVCGKWELNGTDEFKARIARGLLAGGQA
jgi:hypothetical protein